VGLVAAVAVLALMLGALYYAILYKMGVQWYDDPDYSHGFLVPLMAAYFVWERRERLLAIPVQPSLAGIGLLGAGLVMLIVGSVGAELYLQRTSLIVVLAGLVLLILGRASLHLLVFPIVFLLFMVPLPAIVVNSCPSAQHRRYTAASSDTRIPVRRRNN
jgi:exosortase